MKTEVEIFLAKPGGLDLDERKDKTYLCCVFYLLVIKRKIEVCTFSPAFGK